MISCRDLPDSKRNSIIVKDIGPPDMLRETFLHVGSVRQDYFGQAPPANRVDGLKVMILCLFIQDLYDPWRCRSAFREGINVKLLGI